MFSVYVFPFRGTRPKVCLLGTLNTEADKWRQKTNKSEPQILQFSWYSEIHLENTVTVVITATVFVPAKSPYIYLQENRVVRPP